jgi:hypothetical protein
MFDIIYRFMSKLMRTRLRIERYTLPYDHQEASRYPFNESVSLHDRSFWTMCRVDYKDNFLFFHKKTNLVFDEKMNLLGRYVNDELIITEDLRERKQIEQWLKECREKPLTSLQEMKEDVLEKLFEIV